MKIVCYSKDFIIYRSSFYWGSTVEYYFSKEMHVFSFNPSPPPPGPIFHVEACRVTEQLTLWTADL